MRFTRRTNGWMATTVRVAHHLTPHDVAFILAEYACEQARKRQAAVADVFPFSRTVVEDAVREHLWYYGARAEGSDDVSHANHTIAQALARTNVTALYGEDVFTRTREAATDG